jgi:riboflavin synthase alpha subunit
LSVKTDVAMGDAYVGCSIAVNGVCLTATSIDPANKVRRGWQL